MNWRWPAKRGNSLAPWYSIAWRILWWVPLVASLCLLCLFVLISHGPTAARECWRDVVA